MRPAPGPRPPAGSPSDPPISSPNVHSGSSGRRGADVGGGGPGTLVIEHPAGKLIRYAAAQGRDRLGLGVAGGPSGLGVGAWPAGPLALGDGDAVQGGVEPAGGPVGVGA